jgi:hypothetical protein
MGVTSAKPQLYAAKKEGDAFVGSIPFSLMTNAAKSCRQLYPVCLI